MSFLDGVKVKEKVPGPTGNAIKDADHPVSSEI